MGHSQGRLCSTYALKGRVHEACVAMIEETWWETSIFLFLLASFLLPVELLRCLLALVFHHRGGRSESECSNGGVQGNVVVKQSAQRAAQEGSCANPAAVRSVG